ncbi:hypothetical protein CYLTODRAFT_374656 [Cylindrobasidium torrendii FP15055 ss-10]|uniref:Extracellular membrane protein CFEM domain-containing protein n=1 Tax=Cylindrobasidium torrendii FP15055 ss-10 TaxID=1314674 RepID=A0A0D7BDR0_9AGAR|nr:hypothetical protein CYLTODRAFT_374656 [Cylindrobasidium torrendii FP15055 ss-10]
MKFAVAASLAILTPVFAKHGMVQKRGHAQLADAIQAREEQSTDICSAAVASLGQYTVYEPACVNLIYNCLDAVNSTEAIWSQASCVAAATCDGTRNLYQLAQCQNSAISTTNASYLDYGIYANITGECAYAEGGCSMTQQNFVDFFYATLSSIESPEWPSDANSVVTNYWDVIKEWVAVEGDDIPYMNFADFLLYSDSYAEDVEEDGSCEEGA